MEMIGKIKIQINELEKKAKTIEKKGSYLINNADMKRNLYKFEDIEEYDSAMEVTHDKLPPPYYTFKPLSDKWSKYQRQLLDEYENWYMVSCQFIKGFSPEHIDDFNKYYKGDEGVYDFLDLTKKHEASSRKKIISSFVKKFDDQRRLLKIIPDIIMFRKLYIRREITINLVETDIELAEKLFQTEYVIGAGILAGYALEKHLKWLYERDHGEIKGKSNLGILADRLHGKKIIDDQKRKEIDSLKGIRDKCAHIDKDVSKEDIETLLESTKKIIKRYPL